MMKGERKETQKGDTPEISFNNAYMYLSSSLSLLAGTLVSSSVIVLWRTPPLGLKRAGHSRSQITLEATTEDHPR